MVGDLPQADWCLPMTAREPDQAMRLARFRAAHPEVIIGEGGFGTWQARSPEPDGETVFTRHLLRELLDKLEEFFAGPAPDPG
jgi:hypothetical protein